MRVRFWGTRGSLPKPGPTTLRYGGNTSCTELRTEDGTLLVLDCGTGIHELGRALTAPGRPPTRGHLLIGHTHWDHIQGFPFFAPLFTPGSEWDVYAPGGGSRHIQSVLSAQMAYEYHPITLTALESKVRFHDLKEGHLEAGSAHVTAQYMNHPAMTLGYRVEADGAVVVYATDHEPNSLYAHDGSPGERPVHHGDRRHVEFLQGADLVIHDAQYALDQFPTKAGWGHSPVERVVDYALAAGVRRLALFHHDPERDDAQVDRLEEAARRRVAEAGRETFLEVFAAREGQTIPLPQHDGARPTPTNREPSALLELDAPTTPATVLVVEDDPDMSELVCTTLQADRLRTLTAGDGESALKLARSALPDLVLLDVQIPAQDGLSVCRHLRAERDPALRHLPVLILTGVKLSEDDVIEAFRAGASDYLTKPIKPTLLRSRVQGWLLRRGRWIHS